ADADLFVLDGGSLGVGEAGRGQKNHDGERQLPMGNGEWGMGNERQHSAPSRGRFGHHYISIVRHVFDSPFPIPHWDQGFSAWSQTQGVRPRRGQRPPYFAWIAASRSTSAMLASVASHASTSANSAANSALSPARSAADNSPISSMNHMNVPSTPRWRSLPSYS